MRDVAFRRMPFVQGSGPFWIAVSLLKGHSNMRPGESGATSAAACCCAAEEVSGCTAADAAGALCYRCPAQGVIMGAGRSLRTARLAALAFEATVSATDLAAWLIVTTAASAECGIGRAGLGGWIGSAPSNGGEPARVSCAGVPGCCWARIPCWGVSRRGRRAGRQPGRLITGTVHPLGQSPRRREVRRGPQIGGREGQWLWRITFHVKRTPAFAGLQYETTATADR